MGNFYRNALNSGFFFVSTIQELCKTNAMTKLHTEHQCPVDNIISLCNMFSLAFQKHINFFCNEQFMLPKLRSPLIDHAIGFPPLI